MDSKTNELDNEERLDEVREELAGGERMMKWFRFAQLPPGPMRETSKRFCRLAVELVYSVAPGPERTVALRKLVESKDCAVRAVIEGEQSARSAPASRTELPAEKASGR